MNKFNLKYYPPNFFILLVCLITASNVGVQAVWKYYFANSPNLISQLISIATSSSLVVTIFVYINKRMWPWWLNWIGLIDVRGRYEGSVISSYHVNDDDLSPNVQLYCKVTIVQNVNGLHLKGDFYTDQNFTQRSSSFISFHEEIEKLDDGNTSIRYFFGNKGNQLHSDNARYGLNNHDGIAVLTFNVESRKIQGYYFNHERRSHGEILLNPIS